jgi:hypothetical protein
MHGLLTSSLQLVHILGQGKIIKVVVYAGAFMVQVGQALMHGAVAPLMTHQVKT